MWDSYNARSWGQGVMMMVTSLRVQCVMISMKLIGYISESFATVSLMVLSQEATMSCTHCISC